MWCALEGFSGGAIEALSQLFCLSTLTNEYRWERKTLCGQVFIELYDKKYYAVYDIYYIFILSSCLHVFVGYL